MHALEKEVATHSSILAWRIPGTEGAWWTSAHGVAQSWTRLKQQQWLSASKMAISDLHLLVFTAMFTPLWWVCVTNCIWQI